MIAHDDQHLLLPCYLFYRFSHSAPGSLEGVVVMRDKAVTASVPFDCGKALFYRENIKCYYTDSLSVIHYNAMMFEGLQLIPN